MTFDGVLEKFPNAKRAGSGWLVRCPAHDDGKASLSIGQGEDGRVLLKCHAGCAAESIVAAVGLQMKDLMPETELEPARKVITKTYDYCDEAGALVFQVVRYYPKDFRQRKPDGKGGWNWSVKGTRALPYNLKAILDAPDRAVAVVEGEKDVESLARIGVLATCNAGGAGKWTKEHAKFLVGRSVVVLPDNDAPGEKHAAVVCESLDGIASAVRVVRLPDLPAKGDASDWVQAGGTKEALRELASKTPLWVKSSEPAEQPKVDPVEDSGVRRTSMQDAAENYLRKLAAGRETLIDTGIPLLDYSLGGGVTYGEMVIVAARPSHGKSAIGLQMAHAMSQAGLPVVLVSEEMSALAIGKRAVQFVTGTPEEHWRDQMHIVQEEVYEHFRARADIAIIESCGSVERACAEIEALHADGKCKVAIVDYAQLLDAKGKDARERVSLVSKTLKMLAGRLQIVVIVLAQLNREIESRKPYVPKMSDIKETGQLEQDADVIIFGIWPNKIDPTADKRRYQFYVGKNRNRAINEAAFEVEFLPARQKLVDLKPETSKAVTIGSVTFSQDFEDWQG